MRVNQRQELVIGGYVPAPNKFFSFSAAVGLMLVFFIPLVRRSVAKKGTHIGGE
jgi:hypothetical protein